MGVSVKTVNLQNSSEMFLKSLCSHRHGASQSFISVEKDNFNDY